MSGTLSLCEDFCLRLFSISSSVARDRLQNTPDSVIPLAIIIPSTDWTIKKLQHVSPGHENMPGIVLLVASFLALQQSMKIYEDEMYFPTFCVTK